MDIKEILNELKKVDPETVVKYSEKIGDIIERAKDKISRKTEKEIRPVVKEFCKKYGLPGIAISQCGCSYDDGDCWSSDISWWDQEYCFEGKWPEESKLPQTAKVEYEEIVNLFPEVWYYGDTDAVELYQGHTLIRLIDSDGNLIEKEIQN